MQCLTLFACNINGCFSERKNECICTVEWAFTLLEKKTFQEYINFSKKKWGSLRTGSLLAWMVFESGKTSENYQSCDINRVLKIKKLTEK